jgi:hypothetical protein
MMGAAEMKGNGQKHQPKVEACEAKSGELEWSAIVTITPYK